MEARRAETPSRLGSRQPGPEPTRGTLVLGDCARMTAVTGSARTLLATGRRRPESRRSRQGRTKTDRAIREHRQIADVSLAVRPVPGRIADSRNAVPTAGGDRCRHGPDKHEPIPSPGCPVQSYHATTVALIALLEKFAQYKVANRGAGT